MPDAGTNPPASTPPPKQAPTKQAPPKDPPEPEPTPAAALPDRTILKRETVLVISGAKPEQVAAARKALGITSKALNPTAWIEVATVKTPSTAKRRASSVQKSEAIQAYTGPAGEPDTKVGVFKAPTASEFAGGLQLTAPARPLVTAEAID